MSDDTNPQLQVQVDVTADASGAKQVADALGNVKDQAQGASGAADDASGSMDKMGEGAMGAGHVLHGLEMAAQGSARGMFSAATGARHLLEALGAGALGGIALVIGGIAAGVMALMRQFGESKEEAKKLAEEQEKVYQQTLKWRALHMDDLKREYENVHREIEGTLKAAEMLYAAQMKLLDARTASKLANLDIDEQLALGKLKPGDEMGRKRVTKEYADQRATIQDDANVDKAFEAKRLADQKAQAMQEKSTMTGAAADDVMASFQNARGMAESLQVEDIDIIGKLANPLSKGQRAAFEDRRKKIAQELERIQDEQQKRAERYEKLAEQANEEDAAAAAAQIDVASATAEFGNARAKRTGSGAKSRNDDRQIAYEEQQAASKADRERQRTELERQKEALDAKERADKEHLQLARHGEAPEEIANLHAAAAGAQINLSRSTQDLIQTLIKATEEDARQKQSLIEQIKELRAKQDATITN